MTRAIVCGGRSFSDRAGMDRELDMLSLSTVIHGMARGADTLAGEWATSRGVLVIARPARWDLFGLSAGPMRNREMLELEPDLVVAFPGGSGTQDMIVQAFGAGVRVIEPMRQAPRQLRLL